MAHSRSKALWSQSLFSRLDTLRTRGQQGLRAALAPPAQPEPDALPSLQGEDLARHHLGLAIDALREPGKSKPEAFATLRLLINRFEQSTGRPALRPIPVETAVHEPVLGRRARLLNRAFESANLVAAWRSERDDAPSLAQKF